MRLDRVLLVRVVAFVALGGCTLAAPVPGGPLRPGTYTQVQPTWSVGYGPASAGVDGMKVSGSGQAVGQGLDLPFLPITVGVRQALGSAFEVSADAGWLDSGAEIRAGRPVGAVPLALSAGVRSSYFALVHRQDPTYSARLRLEAYPSIAHSDNARLILAGGLSWGAFEHTMFVPSLEDGDVPTFDADLTIVRPEARLELAVGVDIRLRRAAVSVVVAPWVLLYAGAPTVNVCEVCGRNAGATSFTQAWGFNVMFSPSLAGDLLALLSGG